MDDISVTMSLARGIRRDLINRMDDKAFRATLRELDTSRPVTKRWGKTNRHINGVWVTMVSNEKGVIAPFPDIVFMEYLSEKPFCLPKSINWTMTPRLHVSGHAFERLLYRRNDISVSAALIELQPIIDPITQQRDNKPKQYYDVFDKERVLVLGQELAYLTKNGVAILKTRVAPRAASVWVDEVDIDGVARYDLEHLSVLTWISLDRLMPGEEGSKHRQIYDWAQKKSVTC